MDSAADTVTTIARAFQQAAHGQQVTITPPPDRACSTCPWRTANQATPPDRPDAVADPAFYTAEAREQMWTAWAPGRGVRDGCRFECHRNATPTHSRWCAGGDGIQQRELLRWWLAGASPTDYGALTGPAAVLQAVAAILGRFVATGQQDGRWYVQAGGIDLHAEHDHVRVTVDGETLGLRTIARLAHPAVLDADLATEQAPPLTPDERTQLTALGVGEDWADGPGHGTTVALGG